MIEEFKIGGGVMWFLLICMVIGLAIIIERFFSLLIKIRLNPKVFLENLISTIEGQGVDAAMALCDQTPSPAAKIAKAILEKSNKGKDVMEEVAARAAAVELAFLDRGMALLAGLTTVAPFLGFLGTVTGMIRAFAAIAAAGEVEPTVVASGISEALVTTKWGLIIATPLALLHIVFSGRIDNYTKGMEEVAAGLIDYMLEYYQKRKK